MFTYDMAERVSSYYCAVRDLEDKLGYELGGLYTDHPDWDLLSDQLYDNYALTDTEEDLLCDVLNAGLCDYFGPEAVVQVMESHYGITPTEEE
jgi:hypothetical protein